jgi:hypothetical protein
VIAAPGHYDAPQRSPGVSGTGASFFAPPDAALGKGACQRNQRGNGVFQPQGNLFAGCALSATGRNRTDPTEAPASEDAGARET